MRRNRDSAILMAAMMAALHNEGGVVDLGLGRSPVRRQMTVPTPAEEDWMESLEPYRRNQWRRRFASGLTSEQRRYVDSQVSPSKKDEP